MKLAILGGNGFIGTHIAEAALARGDYVRLVDRDPAAVVHPEVEYVQSDIRTIRRDDIAGFDRVYHVAGELGTAETFDNPENAVDVNIVGTLHVLETAAAVKVPVSYVTLGNDWLNPYSITKNAASAFCRMYNEESWLATQVVVTYNLYGPYQKVGPVRKIVPEFMKSLLSQGRVEVFGTGRQVVDMVYARDFAEELLNRTNPGVLHIGTGVPHTVLEVAELCASVLGLSESYETMILARRRGEPEGSTSLSPHGYKTIEPTPIYEALSVTARYYEAVLASDAKGVRTAR